MLRKRPSHQSKTSSNYGRATYSTHSSLTITSSPTSYFKTSRAISTIVTRPSQRYSTIFLIGFYTFPLPHIEMLVDAMAGHQLMSFMDAFSGYNQILMHPEDQEKTSFMTSREIYCYKVMPFGLKNARSTYQRW